MTPAQRARLAEHSHVTGDSQCRPCVGEGHTPLKCFCGGVLHYCFVQANTVNGRNIILHDILCDLCGDDWARNEAAVAHFKAQKEAK